MLRTASPNISVITNFGCNANCWYCIWKQHPLKNIQLDTDWNKVEKFFFTNKAKGKVSVSGGGDCLFKYEKYKEWWDIFFALAYKYSLKVDVHSRIKFYNKQFWKKINRCVVSSDSPVMDALYLRWLSKHTKLRITHVVTANTTEQTIKDYLYLQKTLNCQFTIKQLVNYDDSGNFIKYRNMYPDLFYLEDGDYNIYYMPDNTIKEEFLYAEDDKDDI
jgi:hypothetical protein